ncbi:hypothetical protein [Thorsellia anophelis]|uniref:Uncharacterized protein n=1 Tax=Thorsellia anophelis DSM 18579 TaxID=1123402 RepID=A0A1I0AMU4_9GAMM|nr:hypothetical protein [Thorsellia anophelis]SES95195.1 hypothetical protein SAMN02583745_00968 [Thorsellia anophelis DSM 18579]
MKINNKITLIAVALATALSAQQASALQGGSDLTNTVKGYYPYLSSVGTQLISGGQIVNEAGADRVYPKMGAIIEVPTYITDTSTLPANIKKLYQYKDFDTDPDTTKNDDVVVTWYIVKPKAGKDFAPVGTTYDALLAGPDTWVKSWDDIEASDAVVPADLVRTNNNLKSWALKVPAQAIFGGTAESTEDLRIGFTIVPKSEYGDPIEGHMLKAFDISYLYQQQPPTEPGDPDPENPDPGEPGGENPDNGGGPIQPGNPIEFVIYDTLNTPATDDDVVLGPNDYTKVRHTYRVEAQIREGTAGNYTYRSLSPAEEANLSWQLWDPKTLTGVTPAEIGIAGTTPGLIRTFDKDTAGIDQDRFKQLDNTLTNPDGTFQVAASSVASYTLFTTQDFNADALAQQADNLSEQGMRIRVIYDDGTPTPP